MSFNGVRRHQNKVKRGRHTCVSGSNRKCSNDVNATNDHLTGHQRAPTETRGFTPCTSVFDCADPHNAFERFIFFHLTSERAIGVCSNELTPAADEDREMELKAPELS